MKKYIQETAIWGFTLLPYVYIASIWNELPDRVPTHFNIYGIANDWSSKAMLIIIPGGLGLFINLIMLLIPVLDPKKKIPEMGDKYFRLRAMLTIHFSILAIYLTDVIKIGSLKSPSLLFALIGLLFTLFGNYFQTVRPNYFIGIRTPWTLENEQVWKKTHRLGGRIWIGGGILIIFLAYFIKNMHLLTILFSVIIFIMATVPIIYSYNEFQKEFRIR